MIKLNKVILGLVALSSVSTSFAASMEPVPASDPMQLGVSGLYEQDFGGFAVGLDAQNSNAEAGLVFNGYNIKTVSNVKYGIFNLGGYVGKRQALKNNFFGAVGLGGSYRFLSGDWRSAGIAVNHYTVGPYVGLEYQPESHVQLFVRLMPIVYERSSSNSTELEYFADGQMGVKYFW